MPQPSLGEKRLRLVTAHLDHIMTAWTQRSRRLADPVVVLADGCDPVGRVLCEIRLGASAQVISAAKLAAILEPYASSVSEKLRRIDHKSLYLVCLAYGGYANSYVNARADGRVDLVQTPGRAPAAIVLEN